MHPTSDGTDVSRGHRATSIALHLLLGLLLAGGLVLLFGALVMVLWNAILPHLLGVSPIGYWQSVGLLLLTRILIGSLGMARGRHSHWLGRNAWREYDEWWHQVGEQSLRESLRGSRTSPPSDTIEGRVENPQDPR
jgi:hypothetical protein